MIDKIVEFMIVLLLILYEIIVGFYCNLGVNKKIEIFVVNMCLKLCVCCVYLCIGYVCVFIYDLVKCIIYVWNYVWIKLNVYI